MIILQTDSSCQYAITKTNSITVLIQKKNTGCQQFAAYAVVHRFHEYIYKNYRSDRLKAVRSWMLNAVSQEPFISRDAQHRDVTNDYQSVKRDHYLTSEKNRGVYDQN